MLDYQAIGARIREERKLNKGVSQETMAADLGIYQADVSNLERGRKGSGIADLNRLERLARYFGIPLEALIFGHSNKDTMLKYERTLTLGRIPSGELFTDKERETISRIFKSCPRPIPVEGWQYGPYRLFFLDEAIALRPKGMDHSAPFVQRHAYLFYEEQVIASMRFAALNVFMAMNQPFVRSVQRLVPFEVFDFADVARRVNPYVALMHFELDEGKAKDYEEKFWERIRALHPINTDPLAIIESVYVREDCRRHGLCRLMIDAVCASMGENLSMWINLQPTDDEQIDQTKKTFPEQTQLTAGVMNLNAMVAERLGFTMESDCWDLPVLVKGEDGAEREAVMPLRKVAYRLGRRLAAVLAGDGDLVEVGRAMQKIAFSSGAREPEQIGGSDADSLSQDPVPVVEVVLDDSTRVFCPYCGKETVALEQGRAGAIQPCEHLLFAGSGSGASSVRPGFPVAFGKGDAAEGAIRAARRDCAVCFAFRAPEADGKETLFVGYEPGPEQDWGCGCGCGCGPETPPV